MPGVRIGVLSVFALLNTLQSGGHQMSEGMIFLFGIVLATAVELVAGWLLDVCFHARWWDYSNKPLNFHGYICLEFSLIWGTCHCDGRKGFFRSMWSVRLLIHLPHWNGLLWQFCMRCIWQILL